LDERGYGCAWYENAGATRRAMLEVIHNIGEREAEVGTDAPVASTKL
jgi:hypothetical protein